MAEEDRSRTTGPERGTLEETGIGEGDTSVRRGWREIFRQAFDKARQEQRPADRRDLGQDRSRSLLLLAGAAIVVVLLFLGIFSSNTTKKSTSGRPPGIPDLGRRITPGTERGQTGSVTPLLNAQTLRSEADHGVTAEEVGRTARPKPTNASATGNAAPYALGKINFSDTPPRSEPPPSSSIQPTSDDLRKPSLVFVRSVQNEVGSNARSASAVAEENPVTVNLPTGTRLIARLQSVVSSAVRTPVVAAIEYNYERDGGIVVPAGAQVLGSLQQADRSGYVVIRFDTIQMPDGSTEKIDATAMSLNFGPLKGVVSGKRTGTNFLVRTFTGVGQAASYLVGSNGLNTPLSQGDLLRDQIATNIGIAGSQQFNSLAFNQNIVVSVPGNTRFYVVIEKGTTVREEEARPAAEKEAANTPLPTAEELRQLMQLRREMGELYQHPSAQNTAQQAPQQ